MNCQWITLEPNKDADLRGAEIVVLLSGAGYRPKFSMGASVGTVTRAKDGSLALHPKNGVASTLTARAARDLEFEISEDKLSAEQKPAASTRSLIEILAACPPWARRTVAAHLMPRELAAHDAAVMQARKDELAAIGKAVSRTASTTPAATSVPAGREARAAQLREIGKAASGRK